MGVPVDIVQAAERKRKARQKKDPLGNGQQMTPDENMTDHSSNILDESRVPQAQKIVTLIIGNTDITLWQDTQCTAYATIKIDNHFENMRVDSKTFRSYLSRRFYEENEKPPNGTALLDAIRTIEGEAQYKGERHVTYLRVAAFDDVIYLDLCNEQWQAIEINRQGWHIIDNPPVKFTRTAHSQALPIPHIGGNIELLNPFVNVSDDEFKLIVAWLLSTLRPIGGLPILIIAAGQGGGKTSATRFLRSLIDPYTADTRSVPKDERDLFVAASNNWILAYDNLDYITNELSDALCRLSTGAAYTTRALFTNADETILQAKRPIILNGIGEIANRPDLLDRAVIVHLKEIDENRRIPESELNEKFNESAPLFMGALFEAASRGLANIQTLKLDRTPRMADFALWATACETVVQRGEFLKWYFSNRDNVKKEALNADPVAMGIIEFMSKCDTWTGTASDLLTALDTIVIHRGKHFPAEASVLSKRLKRIAPLLNNAGIFIENDRVNTTRHLTITRVKTINEEFAVTGVTAVTLPANQRKISDSNVTAKQNRDSNVILPSPEKLSNGTESDSSDENDSKKAINKSSVIYGEI
jgi:hypothetical protein